MGQTRFALILYFRMVAHEAARMIVLSLKFHAAVKKAILSAPGLLTPIITYFSLCKQISIVLTIRMGNVST